MLRFMIATGLLALPVAVSAQTPDSYERCRVIAQEMVDYNDNSRLVFERFCETLFVDREPAVAVVRPEDASPPDYFVKCDVAGDPDWIGFRLVTRQQCDEMQGQPRTEARNAPRDFSPR